MPDSPSAASTAAAAATASGKHCPPRITHDSGDFLVLHGKFGGANKGFGEAPKSCTRKEHESATNSIAKRGQGGDFVPFRLPLAGSRDSVPCGVWGNAPTVPRPTNPKEVANKGAGSEASLPVTLRVRRRASKLLFPQDSVKKRFFVCKLQIPRKIAKSIRIFSETLLTNCLSFGILIKLNRFSRANMAQSVEQRFRKPQVEGSSPSVGSLFEV